MEPVIPPGNPRRVSLRDVGPWFADSARLVARKPGYWVMYVVLLFACVVPFFFVPIAGNYLRGLVGPLVAAFGIALAYTQAAEGRISARRAFSLVVPRIPALLGVALAVLVAAEAAELPVLAMIADDREFGMYALSRMQGGTARFGVDLVHTLIVTLVETALGFAIPLVIVEGCSPWSALRRSLAAFALSPIPYLAFMLVGFVIPHSLAYLGLPGVALFLVAAVLISPSGYVLYRAAFGYSAAMSGSGRRRSRWKRASAASR
jgi:hypothetical protein